MLPCIVRRVLPGRRALHSARGRAPAPVLVLAALLAAAAPGAGQVVLERTPNLQGTGLGVPWMLDVLLPHRFRDGSAAEGIDLTRTTTFTGALTLPFPGALGVAYAIQSPTVPDDPDEVQPFARYRVAGAGQAWIDGAVTAAWNVAASSLDVELALARQIGPVRLLAASRFFTDHRGAGESATFLAGGAVWHPLPRSAPVALAGDFGGFLDGGDDADAAWSAGLQVGIPHTALTLSVHATNTAATTLQGASIGDDRVRFGVEATAPIPLGFFFGGYPARAAARESVVASPGDAADAVVEIRRYAYGPGRIVVRAGSVVEWVNRDAVVHTATAEDDAWSSGGIQPGASWRARFEEPGIYPYYCGPHPFMKGVVIVR